MITVKMQSGWTIEVNEDISIVDIQRGEPGFFKTKHGKRETYTVYRGCLIVRSTQNLGRRMFREGTPTRGTAVYLYGTSSENNKPTTFCIAGVDVKTIPQAKRLIDRVLELGWYSYGLKSKTVTVELTRIKVETATLEVPADFDNAQIRTAVEALTLSDFRETEGSYSLLLSTPDEDGNEMDITGDIQPYTPNLNG